MSEINDMENMKAMWNDLNQRMASLEAENRLLARKVMTSGYKTARERLIRKYTAFFFLSFLMIFYAIPFIAMNPLTVEKYRVTTTVYWCVFFAIEAAMDFYLMTRVKKIDVYNSGVSEITRQASKNWKIHKIFIAIGFPLAIGAVTLMVLALGGSRYVVYGMMGGGFVGLLIGLLQLRKIHGYYRMLRSTE